ncbi:hypothetical protein Pelo_18168 [Pelomyxa schiedti]|nr:hypothetical protein Pelo_18168 [Pelomyxa schiedti]
MASSLPRCGARSPARHVSSDAPLMRSWWRRFVLEPSRPFVLVMDKHNWDHLQDDSDDETCSGSGEEDESGFITVSFGVSPVTLGLTHGPRELLVARVGNTDRKWVAPDLCMSVVTDDYGTSMALLAPPSWEQWLVLLEYLASGEFITIKSTRLRCGTDGASGVGVPFPLRPVERAHDYVVMNPAIADEALIMRTTPGGGVNFVLFDVAQTTSSRQLSVLFSAHCSVTSALTIPVAITRKRTGEVVFIVTVRFFGAPYTCACWVEASTGQSKEITSSECTTISQVSSSLFGLWFSSLRFELWDCNNPAKPLRNVDCTAMNLNIRKFPQLPCGHGFLFALSGDKVTVIEVTSGVVVLTIEAPYNLDWIDTDSSLL